jgi:uncharacterized protein (TIGR02147 family)
LVSQIFKADKHLSLEMAVELSEYLGLNADETAFFFLLIEYQKAGSHKLKKTLQRRVKETQKKFQEMDQRLKAQPTLSTEVLNEFYSNWAYAGIWNLLALNQFHSSEMIASRLNLPPAAVKRVIDFLLHEGMAEFESGKLNVKSANIHIGRNSPFTVRHHTNWRLRSIEQLTQQQRNTDLFFSGPLSLSQELADQIREELPAFIEKLVQRIVPSKSEVVRCLVLDWFDY